MLLFYADTAPGFIPTKETRSPRPKTIRICRGLSCTPCSCNHHSIHVYAYGRPRTYPTCGCGQAGSTGKRGRDAMLTQHRITRIIAASDVPAAHLHGIAFIKTGQRLSPGTDAQYETYAKENTSGSIRIASRLSNTRQDGAGNPSDHHEPRAVRDVRQRTLVHEIGHHQDDSKHEPNTGPMLGMKEARAENYADVHLGATKTTPEAVYDDPGNRALSPLQLKAYAQTRVSDRPWIRNYR